MSCSTWAIDDPKSKPVLAFRSTAKMSMHSQIPQRLAVLLSRAASTVNSIPLGVTLPDRPCYESQTNAGWSWDVNPRLVPSHDDELPSSSFDCDKEQSTITRTWLEPPCIGLRTGCARRQPMTLPDVPRRMRYRFLVSHPYNVEVPPRIELGPLLGRKPRTQKSQRTTLNRFLVLSCLIQLAHSQASQAPAAEKTRPSPHWMIIPR